MTITEKEITSSVEDRAAGIAEHWQQFVQGHEPGFLAYFMLEEEDHQQLRRVFLTCIGAEQELPGSTDRAVLKIGQTLTQLHAIPYFYNETSEPYGVMYVGRKLEPIQ